MSSEQTMSASTLLAACARTSEEILALTLSVNEGLAPEWLVPLELKFTETGVDGLDSVTAVALYLERSSLYDLYIKLAK